jgi:hypothetical protein
MAAMSGLLVEASENQNTIWRREYPNIWKIDFEIGMLYDQA